MKSYYRLSLKKDANTWWALQGNNVVLQTSAFYLSDNAIANWKDTTIEDVRDMESFGFTRSFAENYQFVNEGYAILSYLWDYYGINAQATLHVETLDTHTLQYLYAYEADLNFLMAERRQDAEGKVFTIDVLQKGIQEQIKSREDIVYEIEVSKYKKVAEIKPMKVLGKASWTTAWPVPGEQPDALSLAGQISSYKLYLLFAGKTVVPINEASDSSPISTPGQNFEFVSQGAPVHNGNCLLRANVDLYNVKVDLTVKYYIKNNQPSSTGVFGLYLNRVNAAGTVLTTVAYQERQSILTGQSVVESFGIDANIPIVNKDESLILTASFRAPWASGNAHEFAIEPGTLIKVEFEHYSTPLKVEGVSVFDIGKELVYKLTDGQAALTSSYLTQGYPYSVNYDLIPRDILILSGDSIRFSNARIKIKWSNYVQAMRSVLGAAWGIEDNMVRMEKRSYFLDKNKEIADLGEVADMTEMHLRDLSYNQLKIGYEEQDYDELNGKDEFNTTYNFEMPIPHDKNELDMVSPIRADGLGIFYTWVNYVLQQNKDSSSDNDLFFLQITPVPQNGNYYRALYYNDIWATGWLSGLLDAAHTMNIGLSPKRCLLRNSDLLHSLFYTNDAYADNDYMLSYRSTDKNPNVSGHLSTNYAVYESADVSAASYSPRLFLPRQYEISVAAPKGYLVLWQQNRNGYFRFSSGGVLYKGFPISCRVNNAAPQTFTYMLIAHPQANHSY